MKSHEVFRELFSITSPKRMAAELGLSLSLIYKWAEPPGDSGSGSQNPLDRIATLIELTSDPRIAQWICQRAGGFYTKNPHTPEADPECVVSATHQIVQEFADLLSSIALAASDNRITGHEAQHIRSRWEHLKTVTESFVCCCENGNFEPLRSPIKPVSD
jgi:hypothetical protein